MGKTPERFLWAAELLNIQPNQRILEIGCGAGLLAEQICNRLPGGRFEAIDRSASMVEKACKRNQVFIEAGWATFITSDFKDVELLSNHYDTIVAFNVNFFLKNEPMQIAKTLSCLKESGQLFVFYQAPVDISIEAAKPIRQNLVFAGCKIIDTVIQKFQPASAICIIAGFKR